jgi:hypothetical protein
LLSKRKLEKTEYSSEIAIGFTELIRQVPAIKRLGEIRLNIVLSGIIIIIVVGVWSLWN